MPLSTTWDSKDPDEVLDYEVNWAARLDDDTISSSTWIFPTGLTKDSDTFTDTTTTVWISEGVEGETYQVVNRIVTAGGRTMDQTMKLKVKTK